MENLEECFYTVAYCILKIYFFKLTVSADSVTERTEQDLSLPLFSASCDTGWRDQWK